MEEEEEAAKASLDFCWCFFLVLTPDCYLMLLVKYFNALHSMYQYRVIHKSMKHVRKLADATVE